MKKMDEMELRINIKGIRWSWFFLVISLFIWGIFDYLKTRSISLPFILFTLQFLVYFFVTSIAKWKVGDDRGKKMLGWYLAGFSFFIILFGILLYLVIGQP